MTSDELKGAWKHKITSNDVLKIKHKNFKTVYYFPTGYEALKDHHKLDGYWICIQTADIIIPETIKIKKDDLVNWNIVEN